MMKITHNIVSSSNKSIVRISAIALCAGMFVAGSSLLAGDAASTGSKNDRNDVTQQEQPEDFSNWINLSLGGIVVGGDKAQFRQEHHEASQVYGGIEDMHYEHAIGKKGMLKLDAHAIFDNDDYKVQLELSEQGLGYIKAGYTQFRTWYDGHGGFFPALPPGNNTSLPPVYPKGRFFNLYNNDLALDRGNIWVELGLRMPVLPEITVRYEHQYRDGQKDSTSWGSSYQTGIHTTGTSGLNQRKFVPTFRGIDEQREVLAADGKKTIFGNTDLSLGMRYEYTHNTDALNMHNRPGEAAQKGVPVDLFVTQVDKLNSDLFNGHVSSETRFNDKLWFTMGYSYTTVDEAIGGSRITGTTGYYPAFVNSKYMGGFYDLDGKNQTNQHVININLLAIPLNDLTILAATRIDLSRSSSDDMWVNTSTRTTPTVAHYHGNSNSHMDTIDESLELRYTGINNVVLYAKGEWQERQGTQQEFLFNLSGSTPALNTIDDGFADTNILSQKYSAGANWYPLRQLNMAFQYYHKIQTNDFSYAHEPGIINNMKFNVDDVNYRITLKPMNNLAIVSRYDFQRSVINNNDGEAWQQSSVNQVHMFTESITWTPLARLYTQGNFSYVVNQTNTPAGSIVASGSSSGLHSYDGTPVINFSNNYWTAGGGFGFAIDDKTDLRADYSYYVANNYYNNAKAGMPYGAGAEEHEVSASLGRKISRNVHLTLKYSYYKYTDKTSGYHNNYDAHVIYSGVQVYF